jgi:unsaturated rhamnogalacturonyl hydrolase
LRDAIDLIYRYADGLMSAKENTPLSTGRFTWDTEKKQDSWRYFNGVMLDAFDRVMGEKGHDYVAHFYMNNLALDGPRNYHHSELDSVPCGLALFDPVFLESTNGIYIKAIRYIWNELENQPSFPQCGGNYLHKTTWTSFHIGLDGIYMAQIFLSRCAKAIEEGKLTLYRGSPASSPVSADTLYGEIFNRLHWIAEYMYDETTGLYHHGWNAETMQGNGHFWGRGIGWYAVALADITASMPAGEMKETLKLDLIKLFDGMLRYMDEKTGLWYNIVNRPDLDGNRLETSVSAMMAYSMLKASNEGLVPADYGKTGLKSFKGICDNKVIVNNGTIKVIDTYQKSGVSTTDEGYLENPFVDDEAKGTGLLILAAKEAERFADQTE